MKPVYVISAPSGAGKTTLNRKLIKEFPQFQVAVSCTSRPKRDSETDGIHYHFITEADFQAKIEHGQMLEWASVHGNLYGTAKEELERLEKEKLFPILEIDVQGWEQAKPKLMKSKSIFILPPSIEDLWLRLKGRGTDMQKSGLTRFLNAKREIECAHLYDDFIINETIEEAYAEMKSIILDNKDPQLSRADGLKLAGRLLDEFRFKDKIIARHRTSG